MEKEQDKKVSSGAEQNTPEPTEVNDLTEKLIQNEFTPSEEDTPESVEKSAKTEKKDSRKKAAEAKKRRKDRIAASRSIRSRAELDEELSAPEEDIDRDVQRIENANAAFPEEEIILQKRESVSTAGRWKQRRHWYGLPVGLLVLCLAAVGLVFVCQQAYLYIYNAVTDDTKEREYDAFISTVVMMDPEPFENISAANNATILETAIWQTVFNSISGSQNFDEYARMILPENDVIATAVSLFGVNCILTPTDIDLSASGIGTEAGTPESTIAYDAESKTYHVPLLATVGTYQPYVLSIDSRNRVDTLRVAYCIIADSSTQLPEDAHIVGDGMIVIKEMEYEISYDHDLDQKYISAIRNIEE